MIHASGSDEGLNSSTALETLIDDGDKMIRTRLKRLLSLLGSPAPLTAAASASTEAPTPPGEAPRADSSPWKGPRLDIPLSPPPAPASRFDRVRGSLVRRVDSIANSFTGLGGDYDRGAQGRPNTQYSELTFDELTSLWRFNGYAKRIVSLIPDDSTRKGWTVNVEGIDVEDINKETERLCVVGKVNTWLKWAHLYGGSVILIVTDEDEIAGSNGAPHLQLREPLDLSRVKRVTNLVVLDRREATPLTYNGDVTSEGFREPLTWWVSPSSAGGLEGFGGGREIHATRLVYMYGSRLSPTQRTRSLDGMDDSILQSMYEQVRNRTTIDQALAILAGEIRVNVLKMRGLADLSASDQAAVAEERFRLMAQGVSMLNLFLLSDGEEFEQKSASVAGVADLVAPANQSLSAVTGMPAALLFGDAPSGLNTDGESAERKWSKVIGAVQKMKIKDPLSYLYRVIASQSEVFAQGEILGEDLAIKFLPLDELTEGEEAAIRKTYAEIDEKYIDTGVYTASDVADSRFSEEGWTADIKPVAVPDPAAEEILALADAEEEIARLKTAEATSADDVGRHAAK